MDNEGRVRCSTHQWLFAALLSVLEKHSGWERDTKLTTQSVTQHLLCMLCISISAHVLSLYMFTSVPLTLHTYMSFDECLLIFVLVQLVSLLQYCYTVCV